MTLPMPTSIEDIARVLVAADDAYTAHVMVCGDSPCCNCDTLAGLMDDAVHALRTTLTDPAPTS